jgi:(S)-3,5-dihydroxyphenylglycine transaminase
MNPHLNDIGEDVMGFLNEVQMRYPGAVSMASGRPDEEFFDLDRFPEYLELYVSEVAKNTGEGRWQIMRRLGQYGRAKGFVNPVISEYLHKDEGITADPEDIVVTVGSQEAMMIAVLALCDRERDIIVSEDPSYVGMTHLSMLLGYNIHSMRLSLSGPDLDALEALIPAQAALGKRVRVVYVIPDFQNPTGVRMSLRDRERLLELARAYDLFILEDNAYGSFTYDGDRIPSIKSMDRHGRVIYLHSFSKVVCPSLRLGVIVAGQELDGGEKMSDVMAKVKGYITVNTPAIDQAILGGLLINNRFSLEEYNSAKREGIKGKRDAVLRALSRHFRSGRFSWEQEVRWNTPSGGFFITVTVPFPVGKEEVSLCAGTYGLIFTPISFFHLDQVTNHQIRLAFSNVANAAIEPAIERLASFIESKINCSKCNKPCYESKSQY